MSSTPSAPSPGTVVADALWRRNIGLVQLLGLCPMLAVSNQVSTALGLGVATIFVMGLSSLLVSMVRNLVTPETRIAAFVVIIASVVTILELCLRAWAFPLYSALGIFLPLIVTNCAILARAEAFASRNPMRASLLDGMASGAGR